MTHHEVDIRVGPEPPLRILITGAAGLVGTRLADFLRMNGHQVILADVVAADGVHLVDVRDTSAVHHLFEVTAPDVLLHMAAIKNLIYCEKNKEHAHAVNYTGTEILARACAKFSARMVYFSSDYVFGLYDELWTEEDPPCPTTQYGRDKAASECIIRELLDDYAIIRSAQIYGIPGDFIDLVCRELGSNSCFSAYSNLINCPTWIGDLGAMLAKIINYRHRGIFHCVGPEAIPRFQFAVQIADAFGYDREFLRATTLDYSQDVRPPSVRLNGSATYKDLSVTVGTLADNLVLIRHQHTQ